MTRVCIVGCGAVGSLFAAHLAAAGETEVWAYDLDRAHVDAINRDGLRLSGTGEVLGRPRATTDAAALPACEFAIVATKSLHTEGAIAATAHALRDGAVCSVQNGVGNEELIAAQIKRVIRGTTFPAGHVIAPGHVGWDTAGDTTIGPFEPSPARSDEIEQLAQLITRSGMPTRALADARGAQWTKLIFNAATNPIGALTGLSHGRACDQPQVRELIRGLLAEGTAVAAAQGIELDSDPDALVDHAHKVAYDHRASMLQDIQARRATEIDFLNGGIVRFGSEHGVPTPLNEAIWALIRGLESSFATPGPVQHPEAKEAG
ncbi:MAG: ketopantoate reductase family protein [Solirubrobacteraceae bacterium]